jgi:hypothetical protein
MKRILLSIILFPTLCMAQAPAFRFGLKVTPAITCMKPDYQVVQGGELYEGTGAGLAFNWGANMEVKINETVYFVTGLEFNYLSAEHNIRIPLIENNSSVLINYTAKYKMRYLDIPLMLRFRTNLIGNLHYYGLFGGTLGIRTGKEATFTTQQLGATLTRTDEIADYVNPIRGSLNVGLGVELPLTGNTSFLGSVVYNNGLTNILKNIDLTKSREHAILSMVQLNLGILF